MDLFIFLLFIIVIVLIFKDTKTLVYAIGTTDVLLRLIHFMKDQVNVEEFTVFINKYIPSSLMGIVGNYAEGFFYTVLAWLYIVMMCWFVGYLFKYIFKG